jgi:DNA polymerase-4
VALTNLADGAGDQLSLDYEPGEAELDAAVDRLRERFGTGAITRATLLGRRGLGESVPLLPDL